MAWEGSPIYPFQTSVYSACQIQQDYIIPKTLYYTPTLMYYMITPFLIASRQCLSPRNHIDQRPSLSLNRYSHGTLALFLPAYGCLLTYQA